MGIKINILVYYITFTYLRAFYRGRYPAARSGSTKMAARCRDPFASSFRQPEIRSCGSWCGSRPSYTILRFHQPKSRIEPKTGSQPTRHHPSLVRNRRAWSYRASSFRASSSDWIGKSSKQRPPFFPCLCGLPRSAIRKNKLQLWQDGGILSIFPLCLKTKVSSLISARSKRFYFTIH